MTFDTSRWRHVRSYPNGVMSESFDDLVRTHTGAVATYARAITADHWIAEEATHETFVRAWQYLDSFSGTGSFEGWLLRICRNCVTDIAARRWRELPSDRLPDPGTLDPDDLEIDDLLASLSLPQRKSSRSAACWATTIRPPPTCWGCQSAPSDLASIERASRSRANSNKLGTLRSDGLQSCVR
ncbi:MAG: sigma-70 family RNA polymerase sigma factor [Acidimicrobiales bacterium]